MATIEWNLRKVVTFGNIVASIMAILMMIAAFYNLDSRVIENTNHIAINTRDIIEEKEDRKELKRDIYNTLDNLERLLITHFEKARK